MSVGIIIARESSGEKMLLFDESWSISADTCVEIWRKLKDETTI